MDTTIRLSLSMVASPHGPLPFRPERSLWLRHALPPQLPVSPSLGKNLSDSWRIQKCSSAVAPFYAVLSAKVNIETA